MPLARGRGRCTRPRAAPVGLDPAEIVLLDLGAGTGIVGELAGELGIRTVIGVDSLKAARHRLPARSGLRLSRVSRRRPRCSLTHAARAAAPPSAHALISAGAFGGTHAPPAALRNALALLSIGGSVVFTIDEEWMQERW